MAPSAIVVPVPEADDARLVSDRFVEVEALVAGFSAFDFELVEVRRFDNLPNESYVWLAPVPARPFVDMIAALASAFPEHPPFAGAFSTIVPHLTVAASTDDALLRHVEDQLVAALPIGARATSVRVMVRAGGVWRPRAELHLGAP